MKKNSRFAKTRRALLFWTLFIGIGAVAGATGMLADPTGKAMGMDAMLPYFQVLPLAEYLYQDFVFPGFALLIVNGLTNLTAAGMLLAKKRSGVILGGIFGVTLMLWICIQFYMFPMNFMSTSYFVFGFLQAITGYMAWVFEKQERFCVRESDYPNIGTNPKELVVYFSRMGYTKKLALEEANRSGAQVLEIRAKERTEGTPGFWWCGRFGMHRWAMPIEEISADLVGYDCVTVCTPIWVFHLAAPIRAFCKEARGKIKRARYVLVHHQRTSYAEAAEEMDELLCLKAESVTSVCCRRGECLARKELRALTPTNQ
ncbi:MAG: flavodoxin family protein [Faecousia sp.]